jgi:cell division protein ZapA (FtsZ GTPase activity inhibitor)
MKTVEIEIFGKKYYIKTNEPEEVLEKTKIINEQLEKLNERFNTVDYNKLFVLYMLILFDKYDIEKQRNKKMSEELKQVEELLNKLNED